MSSLVDSGGKRSFFEGGGEKRREKLNLLRHNSSTNYGTLKLKKFLASSILLLFLFAYDCKRGTIILLSVIL